MTNNKKVHHLEYNCRRRLSYQGCQEAAVRNRKSVQKTGFPRKTDFARPRLKAEAEFLTSLIKK